jgi:uncharacterized membrane-anchored protein
VRLVQCLALAALLSACAAAQRSPESELQNAIEAAHAARTDGPAEVRLANRMVLQVLVGLSYVPPAQGERLLRSMGQRPGKGLLLGVMVANASDTTDIAALYAAPELEVQGWKAAPALARFRARY